MEILEIVQSDDQRQVDVALSAARPGMRRERSAGHCRNRIFVRKLLLQTRIGVHDWEKAALQPLVLDIECALPSDLACHTDRIADTVDYGRLVERLREMACAHHCELVEAMAERMGEMIQMEFGVPWLALTLMKPAPFPGAEVGISIERGERD